ncbi:MAG TPA: hypothetical protein VFY82_03830 [Acidimicrobiales bacterium]|nr:hypothetical protein [Acidimicrobiales bacterium]
MRDDDVWLDELLAAAAPVADHDLERPEVRNASRALTEELSMFVPTTTRRITGDDGVLSARYGDARPDEGAESAPVTHVPMAWSATAGSRRGWRPLVAAIAAAVVALGSAVYVAGGDRRDSPAEELGVAAPTAADGTPGPAGQQAEHPATACEWTAAWFAADDTGDEIARRQAVAGLADSAAEAQAAGDEVTALRIEATMSPMSAGHREAAEQANAHLGC